MRRLLHLLSHHSTENDGFLHMVCGNASGIRGNVTGLCGDVTSLCGDVTGLRGDVTGLRGDATGLSGNLDECEIRPKERRRGINIITLCAPGA